MTQSSKDLASVDVMAIQNTVSSALLIGSLQLNTLWPEENDDLWWVNKKATDDSKHTVDSFDTSHSTMRNVVAETSDYRLNSLISMLRQVNPACERVRPAWSTSSSACRI